MTNYEIKIWDRHVIAGETTIKAESLEDAIDDATTWAQDGDWDHPGTVEIGITVEGDEDEARRLPVSVGPATCGRLSVGDRVEGGEIRSEDYDRGTVSEITGDQVTVNWDSEIKTTQQSSLLRKLTNNLKPRKPE